MERLISAATPVVLSLLAHQKTATRRLVRRANSLLDGKAPTKAQWDALDWSKSPFVDGNAWVVMRKMNPINWLSAAHSPHALVTPRWKPGDVLAFREALEKAKIGSEGEWCAGYEAMGDRDAMVDPPMPWRWQRDRIPPMFCPRDAIRLRRRLVSVEPSTPGDVCTADEARAEGLVTDGYLDAPEGYWSKWRSGGRSYDTPLDAFRALLAECHGHAVPDDAPCWVYRFEPGDA